MSSTRMRVGRRSRLLAGLFAVLLASISLTGVAHASESIGGCLAERFEAEEAGQDRLHSGDDDLVAEFDKELEECIEAPNPILPELNEIIYGGLAFLILLGALWKWALPAMKSGMAARSDKIREDLAAAEAARLEAEGLRAEYEASLADAKAESGRIVDDARQTADAMKTELAAKAESDIAEMRARAAADIEASKTQAVADLQGEVAELAVGAAEQVVEANLDTEAQTQLIENYINQVRS